MKCHRATHQRASKQPPLLFSTYNPTPAVARRLPNLTKHFLKSKNAAFLKSLIIVIILQNQLRLACPTQLETRVTAIANNALTVYYSLSLPFNQKKSHALCVLHWQIWAHLCYSCKILEKHFVPLDKDIKCFQTWLVVWSERCSSSSLCSSI